MSEPDTYVMSQGLYDLLLAEHGSDQAIIDHINATFGLTYTVLSLTVRGEDDQTQ